MLKLDGLSHSLTAFDQDSTLVVVIELAVSNWTVGGLVPGVLRQPTKKMAADKFALAQQLENWREQGEAAGHPIKRVCVAMEAGRDGFWLARWLRARDIEAYVIHPTSIPVPREHRRAKTDRLDVGMLLRAFLGWLRGERKHCSMVKIPTREEEDDKRPLREREALVSGRSSLINQLKSLLALHGIRGFKVTTKRAAAQLQGLQTEEGLPLPGQILAALERAMARLALIKTQIADIDRERVRRLQAAPEEGLHPMIRIIAMVKGIGLMTAELLVREILSRPMRDRRAIARYGGLTGSPDESGKRRREQGLAKAGNGRVRHVLIELAWRFLRHQKDSALAQWFLARTQDGRGPTRKVMIVALARKLLIALWELATTGKPLEGVQLHSRLIFA
ncbi:MAG TPA: IS110 family transposase [Stellaceae bacterium]|jgi:transposase|nr:IS110 family transposase [Stellaceae bacterium]